LTGVSVPQTTSNESFIPDLSFDLLRLHQWYYTKLDQTLTALS